MKKSKYETVVSLYEDTLKHITESETAWKDFLSSMATSYNYKLPLIHKVLLYAQRPDARAILPLERWNRDFGRFVAKGTKGIAFLNTNNTLKYYFDISDTVPTENARDVPVWDMTDDNIGIVREYLNSNYINNHDDIYLEIENAVYTEFSNIIDDDFIKSLQKENSFFSSCNAETLEAHLKDISVKSSSFLIMKRLNLNPDRYYYNDDEFSSITFFDFNDKKVFNTVGHLINEPAIKILNDISLQLKLSRRYSNERQGQRTDLHSSRGLPVSRPDNNRGTNNREIRKDEGEILEGGTTSRTSESANIGGAVGTLQSNSETGRGKNGSSYPTDERGRGSDGTAESRGYDGLGRNDEHNSLGSGGDSTQGDSIRLEAEKLPSVEEQVNIINEAEEEKTSAFSFTQEIIDEVLTRGSGVEHGKFRIYEQFQKSLSSKENEKFLINEYGWGGAYPLLSDVNIDEQHDGKGIHLSKGLDDNTPRITLKWKQVEKRISELIKLDRYLNPKEKENYPKWLEKNKEETNLTTNLPNDIKYEYKYDVGSVVYIGSSEYEITAISNDRVSLLDKQFPLLNKELSVSDFENKIEQSPMNNNLRVAVEPKEDNQSTDSKEELPAENSTRPTITCEWSEHPDFKGGKTYSVAEFDSIMKKADTEWLELRQKELDTYNNDVEKIFEAYENGEIDSVHLGYAKVKFTVNLPNGTKYTERQDIGDGDGGVIDFLNLYPAHYSNVVQVLKADIDSDNTESIPLESYKQNKEQNTDNQVIKTEKTNFDLKPFEIEEVGKKSRFIRNINAIKVLKECENENRLATPDEQQVLAQYVGWGGIPEAFDQDNTSWSQEFEQLKNLLTPQEYSAARESTLTAFYTPQTVISAVYKALENIGFKGGNILEPSCGTGHFIGMLPDSMQDSKFYGVELDTVSAGIAKQLYQKSSISAQPFEETKLPDSFFDAVIGNVPFGDFGVADKRYDKNHFLIHDYFFAKSLDKLRPGGVIAFITSKGTMDKENSSVRKYIAQRADLLGAIRLPNNTFKGNAGTEVVSDIIFLQKRDRMIDIEPDWVQLSTDENGIKMNSYFIDHPEMILGEAKIVSGRFRDEVTYIPFEDSNLESQLDIAISNIRGTFTEYEVDTEFEEDVTSIPADPDVRNYSYTIVDDVIYFRENSLMYPETVSKTADSRIRGLIGVRDSVRRLIDLQTNDYPDEEIKAEQQHLNSLYDEFTEKYGLINSRANNSAFSQDSSYSLLSSLEVIDDDSNFVRKADIFSKRTIKPHKAITSVDTSVEALTVSISEKAKIDMDYMVALTGKSEEEIFSDLQGVIYLNPHYQDDGYSDKYISADEYLSGNVRQKLNIARECAKDNPQYRINVMALEKVQPKDLSASEISVRLGSTWIPKDVIEDYIYETLETPYYRQYSIKVNFVEHTGEWNITNKSSDKENVKAYKTYGTSRVNGYKLIEDTLNLRDIKVFDYKEDADGKRVAVLNQKETTLAQSKQELIKQNFKNWIWKGPNRRERLCKIYNERFNSIRPREYDGSHITFYGINPEITLRKHQVNAIARILYGGNTLLAHTVGAGKTFEMVAAAMESKRLGLCSKSMFVVPNHLTEQWASEFLQLYPAANILVATKKDFEKKNRRRFCSRISTGDYDAVIIGHSQFEKIPMSFERQKVIIEQQIDEITNGILELKNNNGERFSIKQLEKSRKSLQVKLQKLNDQSRKDDVVTFEELGVDRLFVDESHYYKNLYLYTKMRNVGGIAQTEAQKSQDLFMKCRYLDEITDSKGIVFATGTPISNSMVELYTIQRYLQYNTLVEHNLQHFDAWASTFGETVSAIELNPEGTGYRAKTRFAKFFNLPELMNMFKEVADIQTADMLKLPVPKANYHNVAVKPSEIQTEMVNQLSKRADKVRSKLVDSKTDNMLKITNDGRKLALDQRIINPDLPDFEHSKVNACAENVFRIWKDGIVDKTTQLVFCDLSTPNKDGFNVYDDIKNKLIDKGIPAEEIQFIHDAKTETQKQKLFGKVRNGDVRILFGSTAKMGAGTNVQDRIVASHDIDCPWRPSDLEQRLGRTVRQGNRNKEVNIYRYVTEQTFDAYLYQLVEGKQKFASQIMTSKSPVRIAEDIDETALSYAEIKMLATGNPDIKEKMDLDIQVQKLNLLKSDYLTQKFELEDKIIKYYPQEILAKESLIEGLKLDIQVAKDNTSEKFAGMTLDGVFYEDKKEAGGKLLDVCQSKPKSQSVEIGEYRGFKMILSYDIWERTYSINLKKNLSHYVELSSDVFGNIQRLDNAISNLDKKLDNAKSSLENVKLQLKNAKEEVNKPFEYEDELNTKMQRLNKLNAKLNLDANRADEPSEEEVFFKEVSTEQDKDTLIANGYDNYVKNDRGYIFKVANSDKDKVEQLLAVNNKKMCI